MTLAIRRALGIGLAFTWISACQPTASTTTARLDAATVDSLLARQLGVIDRNFCTQSCERKYFACFGHVEVSAIANPGKPPRGPGKFDPGCWPFACDEGTDNTRKPVDEQLTDCSIYLDKCQANCSKRHKED